MNLYVNWRSAFKAIANNRKRSILTMLGIVIGIAAVIAILAIGRGYERDLIKSLTKSDNGQVEVQIIFNPNDPFFNDICIPYSERYCRRRRTYCFVNYTKRNNS